MPCMGIDTMKYMGHKGRMLPTLWSVIQNNLDGVHRIADPFCGTASVSWFLASHTTLKVVSGDLQLFAAIRGAAVVERTCVLEQPRLHFERWFLRAKEILSDITNAFPSGVMAINSEFVTEGDAEAYVARCRNFCSKVLPFVLSDRKDYFGISLAYGGYYYSPFQALILDSLRQTIPDVPEIKNIFIASLIDAASKCVAAPGHTAQPFQPTKNSTKFILEAWGRNIWNYVFNAGMVIAEKHACVQGRAIQGDYRKCLDLLEAGDMVFADPPYSDVQYSRFYHVLESLAQGKNYAVSGTGRYPEQKYRPVSDFSKRSLAKEAIRELVEICATKRFKLILTFPNHVSSNGLSAEIIKNIASDYYGNIEQIPFKSNFSTLGGNGENRKGRFSCDESILCMRL